MKKQIKWNNLKNNELLKTITKKKFISSWKQIPYRWTYYMNCYVKIEIKVFWNGLSSTRITVIWSFNYRYIIIRVQ